MNKQMRDLDYLEHIEEAIGKTFRYISGKNEADFLSNELIQDAVIRNLEIIGEAVTKLSSELKNQHTDIRWSEISGMRNRLIHGYAAVNHEIVWSTVQKILPDFQSRIKEIKHKLPKK